MGTVIKVILDRNIGEMKKDEETVEGEDDLDENKENIDTTAAGDGEANPESAEEEGFSPEESGDEGE
ncbi:MAG: hypothetical protein K5840_04175 [Eubacterium sp.]|nr:hypothetical protein [Eubacterium sp.]